MLHLTAASIGPIAAEILAPGHEVEVVAVFERSFYLLAHNGLVCVGSEGIGHGPINVPLRDAEAVDWRQHGILPEVKGSSHTGNLVVGGELVISMHGATRWQPPPWAPFESAAAQRGLAAIRGLAAPRLPKEGLAPLVFAAGGSGALPLAAKAAAQQIAHLRTALPLGLSTGRLDGNSARALILLLGLGPGLTPSGDDLIGGIMLALTALGHRQLRDAIWEALAPELNDLTTEISAMHLSAAADGLGAEAVHNLANAIIAGDIPALPAHFDRVTRIGHCSGWDTLSGFAMTIDAASGEPRSAQVA